MPDPSGTMRRLAEKIDAMGEREAYAAIRAGTFEGVEDEDGNVYTIVVTGSKVWGDRGSGWVPPDEKRER